MKPSFLLFVAAVVFSLSLGAAGQSKERRSTVTKGVTLYVSKLGDNSDGRSWHTAYHSIQRALNAVPDEAQPTAVEISRETARELIRDPHLSSGFHLIEPKPGRRVVYGELPGSTPGAKPAWDLDQWSSRFPLAAEAPKKSAPGVMRWSNTGKTVVCGDAGTAEADLALGVNASVEYERRARKSGEPWVHLLVEQNFAEPPSLAKLSSARLRLAAKLNRSEFHRTTDYSPGLHAAQFQMFLMVQNRNRQSRGFGQLVWFGIPLYDDRSRFPKEHKAQDTGGTSMFIFTPAGSVYTERSAHDREWIRIDKELMPLFREALETAWQRGFLTESRDFADYRITGMNLGWEVPGLFDVGMQVRDLSLVVQRK